MIAIIDYGMGNLRSVMNAFRAAGGDARVAAVPSDLADADAVVLPGVGAFADGMRSLRERGFLPALEDAVRKEGRPFLGLCLGMQLMARRGSEHGDQSGLGWIDAVVERLPSTVESAELRVPHVGWNEVTFSSTSGLYQDLGTSESFYFVHSYVVTGAPAAIVSGETVYGASFAASIEVDNIFATQFHPEKSHKAGQAVLRNFLRRVALAAC